MKVIVTTNELGLSNCIALNTQLESIMRITKNAPIPIAANTYKFENIKPIPDSKNNTDKILVNSYVLFTSLFPLIQCLD